MRIDLLPAGPLNHKSNPKGLHRHSTRSTSTLAWIIHERDDPAENGEASETRLKRNFLAEIRQPIVFWGYSETRLTLMNNPG